jgi:hypothetical protein
MKKILLSGLLLLAVSAVFSQSASTGSNLSNIIQVDTMKRVDPPQAKREPIITDEGTNEPTGFEQTTYNGKDIYIKQESQITIIYEPK